MSRAHLGAHLLELRRQPLNVPGRCLRIEAGGRIPLARSQSLRVDVAGRYLDQAGAREQALPTRFVFRGRKDQRARRMRRSERGVGPSFLGHFGELIEIHRWAPDLRCIARWDGRKRSTFTLVMMWRVDRAVNLVLKIPYNFDLVYPEGSAKREISSLGSLFVSTQGTNE